MSEPFDLPRTPAEKHPTAAPGGTKMFHTLDVLRNIASQLLIISDAQFAIWKLTFIRYAALAALAIPMGIAFFLLGIYGFVLLDQAAAAGLKTAQYPDWVSPLIRGGAYSLFVLTVIAVIWRQAIGTLSKK